MPELPVLNSDAVLAAVSPAAPIAATRDAFVRHRQGEWVMPSKVYLESPPHGDFRAMPARGGELAILKWISSFPSNPARGLPTVIGLLVVSDATTSEPVALMDGGAARGGARAGRRLLRHARARGRRRRGRPPRRAAPEHARRRRAGQGRGD